MGCGDKYGLSVSTRIRLAGIPAPAIQLAKQKLRILEQQSTQAQPDLFSQLPEIEEPPVDELRNELEAIDADDLSPRQALELVYRLKGLAKS